ncbi:MAG: DUF1003 domain-containing protein [Anaerolineaceae bacterium]
MINKHLQSFADQRYKGDLDALPPREQKVIKHYEERLPISHNTNIEFDTDLTFGQRLADKVASFGGSWTFITIFGIILLSWVLINSVILAHRNEAFDPYPYILLNLFLSMLASVQAPLILMSQRRQSLKDRLDAEHDYEVNLKAEFEILGLHEKMDELRENKWGDLILMQQEQIRLLSQLLKQNETGSTNNQSK